MRQALRYAFRLESLPTTCASIVLVVTSLILVVLSLTNSLTQTQELAGILTVLSLYSAVAVLERIVTLGGIKRDIEIIRRGHFDLQRVEDFTAEEAFLAGASDVLIIGLNKAGYFLHRVNFFIKLIRSGCNVRVLTLDPNDADLYRVVAANLEVDADRMTTDIQQTNQTLTQIRAGLTQKESTRLQIRNHRIAPAMGLTVVNGEKSNGRLQVYFYAYQTDPPARPGLELYKEVDTHWFEFFEGIAENLWRDAT